ncbi:hypothetical protein [Aliamphritea spongicola]|nr:hypothetical protein [Aliamphritea spongicola]
MKSLRQPLLVALSASGLLLSQAHATDKITVGEPSWPGPKSSLT